MDATELLRVVLDGDAVGRIRQRVHALDYGLRTRLVFAVVLLPLLISCWKVFDPLSSKVMALSYLVASVLIFLIARWITDALVPSPARPTGRVFRPIGDKGGTFLPRASVIASVRSHLTELGGGVLIVTGESGAGKSTLVHDLLNPRLREEGWRVSEPAVIGYKDRDSFECELLDALRSLGMTVDARQFHDSAMFETRHSDTPIVLVVDQFEQFLRHARAREQLQAWFIRFLDNWAHGGQGDYCIIVLRQEMYVDLTFLQRHLTDAFLRTIVVPGVSFRDDMSLGDYEEVLDAVEKIREVVEDTDTVAAFKRDMATTPTVLPLIIQMVGFMLEDFKIQNGLSCISKQQYEVDLGGFRGLIHRYFRRYVEYAGEKDVAIAVLYALSSQNHRYGLSPESIGRATHCDQKSIARTLRRFEEGGLVDRTGSLYRMRHDYLSEAFEQMSGVLLEAEYRDNIQYFSENEGQMHLFDPKGVSVLRVDIVFACTLILIVVRFLFPEFGWQKVEESILRPPVVPSTIDTATLDMRYLPALVACTGCLLYCWQLFRNFFCRLRSGKSTTWAVLLGGPVLCATATTVFPHFWMAVSALAGLVIGIRIGALFWGREIKLLHRRNLLTNTGNHTVTNMLVFLSLGIGLASIRYWGVFGLSASVEGSSSCLAYVIEISLATLTCAFIFMCWRNHGTRHKSAIMLGICDRVVGKGQRGQPAH